MGVALLLAAAVFYSGCRDQSEPAMAEPGSLYSVDDGEGWFRVAKVLVTDAEAVHIRLFKNRFKERPTTVDPTTLGLGTIHDKDGFGMGHLPLTRKAWSAWLPVLLERGTVQAEELEGYYQWKGSGGGLFGQ